MPLPTVTLEGKVHPKEAPTLRFTPSGKAVLNFTMVVEDRRKNEDTGKWETTDSMWVRVSCWDRLAENAAETLHEGDEVVVQGKLKNRQYEDRDGQKRMSLECAAYVVAPSLRWAARSAEIRADRQSANAGGANVGGGDDPWAATGSFGAEPGYRDNSEPPFHHRPDVFNERTI